MGQVWAAVDTRLGRRVALKAIPPELAVDPSRLERLRREARTLATLDHPSIVTIFAIEQTEDRQFLVMELVDGETLAVLEPSRDHKAAFDGDTGPNTGGMGAFSPSRLLTRRAYEQIEERVLLPTISAMAVSPICRRG